MAKTNKKRRRQRRNRRLGMIIAAGAVVIGAVFFGVRGWLDRRQQDQWRQEIKAELDTRQQARTVVSQAQLPDSDIEVQAFEKLKANALKALDVDELVALQDENHRISKEELDSALKAKGDQLDEEALYFMENLSQYPGEWLQYYCNDPDRFEFVKAYPQRDSLQNPPAALDVSLESVPHLLQWDKRWGYIPYGDSLISIAGCAPTCLSMVFSYLKQDPTLTPTAMKTWSEKNGYYVSGAGTAHSLLDEAPAAFGVQGERIAVDQASISQALKEGKVLVFNMVPGTFTRVGHFIVVSREDNGKLVVRDPNSIKRTSRTWNYDEVLPETAVVWAYSR